GHRCSDPATQNTNVGFNDAWHVLPPRPCRRLLGACFQALTAKTADRRFVTEVRSLGRGVEVGQQSSGNVMRLGGLGRAIQPIVTHPPLDHLTSFAWPKRTKTGAVLLLSLQFQRLQLRLPAWTRVRWTVLNLRRRKIWMIEFGNRFEAVEPCLESGHHLPD